MKTWGDLNSELSQLLDDTDASVQSYTDELRLIAWNRAVEYFAETHTAPLRTTTLEASGYGDGTLVSLPTDFIQIAGVQVRRQCPDTSFSIPMARPKSEWLAPSLMIPNGEEDTSGYYQIEDGLYFPDPQVQTVVLWYYGCYEPVQDEDSNLAVPTWAEWALLNLAICYLLYPAMLGVSDLSRFKSKREAGQPEDNSSRTQARYHMQVYADTISRHKPQDREMLFKPAR